MKLGDIARNGFIYDEMYILIISYYTSTLHMNMDNNSGFNFSYDSRIRMLDMFLSWIERNTTQKKTVELRQHIKFYILITIHLLLFIPIYIIVLYSNHIGLLLAAVTVLYIQLLFNILDRGCFLMKLERKYYGKQWYGFYTPLVWLFGLERTQINGLFYIFAAVVLGYTAKRCYNLL